jgi:hypothetical protein
MGTVRARLSSRRRRLLLLALFLAEPVSMKLKGYRIGGNLIVRCSQGHLFTTLWIPGASVKSLRFLWWRVQRCPVGNHWSLVTPVREAELNDDERRLAHERHDVRLP